jgi:hypothetical protein
LPAATVTPTAMTRTAIDAVLASQRPVGDRSAALPRVRGWAWWETTASSLGLWNDDRAQGPAPRLSTRCSPSTDFKLNDASRYFIKESDDVPSPTDHANCLDRQCPQQ